MQILLIIYFQLYKFIINITLYLKSIILHLNFLYKYSSYFILVLFCQLKENQIPLSKYELNINLNSIYKGFKSLIQDYFDVQ